MEQQVIETDVLCVGGGTAGMMAAIRAAELGASVIVAEKGNTKRSGAGRAGNDHFWCYIPEVHGPIEPIIKRWQNNTRVIPRDTTVIRTREEKSQEIIDLWESWGIPMKRNGEYHFAGFGYEGYMLSALKYSGHEQKPILTKEAIKRGATIMNRVMVFDLLVDDGAVVGAIGFSTREDKIIIFRAKSVILSTGGVARMFRSAVQGLVGGTHEPFTTTGDGRAMAYRAGAELVDMELTYPHIGPKFFAMCGQGTWVGVVKDAAGNTIGPYVKKPDKRYGDVILTHYPTILEDYHQSGRGPVYMDCAGLSDEDYEYMRHYLKHEGNAALVRHMDEEGIDPRKNPVEIMRYEMKTIGGVYYNEKAETSVAGLYAAGDEIFGGIANAAIFGWIGGENAVAYAKTRQPADLKKQQAFIKERKDLAEAIRSRKTGGDWKEFNFALQETMDDYCGYVRSQTLLEAGLNHLRRIRDKAYKSMKAADPWQLTRCLETLNLLDLCEVTCISADARRESRGRHFRTEYPFANAMLDKKLLSIQKVDNKPVTGWKSLRD